MIAESSTEGSAEGSAEGSTEEVVPCVELFLEFSVEPSVVIPWASVVVKSIYRSLPEFVEGSEVRVIVRVP